MQSYTEIPSSQTLSSSLTLLLNNFKTIMSCSSGTTAPTANLQVGQLFYNTSTKVLQVCTVASPAAWVTIADADLVYVDKAYVDTQLATKQATITGGATTIVSSNLTASRALVSDASGKVAVSAVTSTELGYVDTVTSNIQTQLNGKLSTSGTAADSTKWAGGAKTVSTAAPSGGASNDVWFKY